MSYTLLTDPMRFPTLYLSAEPVDEKPAFPEPSYLLGLPDELKLEIASYIDRKRDLYHLSLTCRELEGVTYRTLYKYVDVEIPQSKHMSWNLGKLPTFRPHVLQTMQNLFVRNGIMDIREPVYNKLRRSEAGSVDGYVCDLVEHTPKNQLRSFAFLHQSALSAGMLEMLATKHEESLEQLQCFEFQPFSGADHVLPRKLRSLECRSVGSGDVAAEIIQANRKTLESLRIGQEKLLIEQYRRSRVGFLDHITQPLEPFRLTMNLGELPHLRRLSLVGLDLAPMIPTNINSALHLCNLESLTIESCANTSGFLEALSSTFSYVQNSEMAPQNPRLVPQMRCFKFRHEAFSNMMKEALIAFLTSFSGLQGLSLLFENATLMERPSLLIATHGPTLKSLIIETRIQPREHLGLDTSRPLGSGGYTHQLWQESINDVCTNCPNLTELGMGFPWDDEMVRLRKTKLPLLKNLKTIHIRNFPQSQVLSQLGDYAIQEYSRKFIEWCFPSLVGGSRPSLETLAIGPTLYESRWKCSPAYTNPAATDSVQSANYRKYQNPPEYLRTHYYCLDWAKTRFGRWNAMITPVSQKCMEELRDEKPLGGVFEQVWLR